MPITAHPLLSVWTPRLSNKDIIERDIPLGGTHWSSVPNPNMTSWIQMAEAGMQAGSWGAENGVVVVVGEGGGQKY